jgi:hypothetical protein
VVCENGEVEEEDTYDNSSGRNQILVNAQDEKAQRGQDIFYDEEVDVSTSNQEIHEGVDFPGPSFNMEDREVGIEDGKQDNEEKGEKEIMAIEIDIHMGFPIRPPPNGLTTAEEHIFAEWFRWLLASIL